MDGLLLRLLEDKHGAPGRWFWPCFKPLRSRFDQHCWVFINQPWMGAPPGFVHDQEMMDYQGAGNTSTGLWRRGAVGRWAEKFVEESVELWAVDAMHDPTETATEFLGTASRDQDDFIRAHAAFWLIYTDSSCWEIFAREPGHLEAIRDHLVTRPSVLPYDTSSHDRKRAFTAAGIR